MFLVEMAEGLYIHYLLYSTPKFKILRRKALVKILYSENVTKAMRREVLFRLSKLDSNT